MEEAYYFCFQVQGQMLKLQAAIKYGEEDLVGAKSLVDQSPADDPDCDINRGCLLYKGPSINYVIFYPLPLSLSQSRNLHISTIITFETTPLPPPSRAWRHLWMALKEARYDEALVKFNGAQQIVG